MHRCVHSWTVFVLNKEWDEGLARLALRYVALKIPMRDETDSWMLQRRLLQHAIRQEQAILEDKMDMEGMEWVLHSLGMLFSHQGKPAEVEAIYIRALQGYKEAFGPKHTLTLSTVNNLGALYKNQGKLAEVEAMYIWALQGYKETLGPKHTSTLDTVNNLSALYKNQGKLAEAEAMYIRALQGYEEALGLKHTSTLQIVNNLGDLYADQGKLAEADAMYIQALQGKEALGPKHTSTLQTVNNLGALYKNQGKLAEAEAMYKNQGKLAEAEAMYKNQGKLAEAEAMYIWALQGYEEALGLECLSSYLPALITMFSFGDLFSRTGRKGMAKNMYTRALSGYRIVQGPSSMWCRELEGRLQELRVAFVESEARQIKSIEIGQKRRSLKQKFRHLGRWLNVG